MEVSIVLATYNEAENIKRLIPEIASTLEGIDREIIVVDDESEDHTADIARRVSVPRKDRVRIIVNKNRRGITYAQLIGIEAASKRNILIMDADGQHEPMYIPKLIERLEEYDLVIGSRYIPGGSPEGLDGLKRYFISYTANLIARILFYPITHKIHDLMSGFFAFRREVLCDCIESRYPKLLLEILVCCKPKRVYEIPIRMGRRRYGETKLSRRLIISYLEQILSLMRRILIRSGETRS